MNSTLSTTELVLSFVEASGKSKKRRYELSSIGFAHPILEEACESHRGRNSQRFGASGTFQWSLAVQALSILLVHTAREVNTGARLNRVPEISGEGKCPARSLDYALGKQPNWLIDVFGADSRGTAICSRLFNRRNPEGRRPGPVAVSVNDQFMELSRIIIRVGSREVKTVEEYDAIVTSIIQNAKYWTNELQEGSNSRAKLDNQEVSEEDALKTPEQEIELHFYTTPLKIERGFVDCLQRRSIEKNFWFVDKAKSMAWDNLIASGVYPYFQESLDIVTNSLSRIAEHAQEDCNIIVLRPGTGVKEEMILGSILQSRRCAYGLVEISRQHIDQSALLSVKHKVHKVGFIADFLEQGVLKRISSVMRNNHFRRNIILSLGNTIGTYPPGMLLGAVQQSLQSGDLFLFDCNVSRFDDEYAEVEKCFGSMQFLDYMCMPLDLVGLGKEDGEVSFEIHERLYEAVPVVEHHFTFTRARNVQCYNSEFAFIKGEKLQLGYSINFSLEVLKALLSARDFNILEIFQSPNVKTALLICKKQ